MRDMLSGRLFLNFVEQWDHFSIYRIAVRIEFGLKTYPDFTFWFDILSNLAVCLLAQRGASSFLECYKGPTL